MSTNTIACPACGSRNRVPATPTGKPRCGTCKHDLPWLTDISGPEFDAVLANSSLPVLVDLWAPWCGPCKAIAPALEQLATDMAGSLRIAKVNVDDWPAVSDRLGVRGIPTMVLYSGGNEIARQVGALPGHQLRRWIEGSLAAA